MYSRHHSEHFLGSHFLKFSDVYSSVPSGSRVVWLKFQYMFVVLINCAWYYQFSLKFYCFCSCKVPPVYVTEYIMTEPGAKSGGPHRHKMSDLRLSWSPIKAVCLRKMSYRFIFLKSLKFSHSSEIVFPLREQNTKSLCGWIVEDDVSPGHIVPNFPLLPWHCLVLICTFLVLIHVYMCFAYLKMLLLCL